MGTENLTGFEQVKDGIAHTASLGQQPGYSVMPRVRDAVFFECLLVLTRIPQNGSQARRAGASGAHEYHVAVDIGGGNAVFSIKRIISSKSAALSIAGSKPP